MAEQLNTARLPQGRRVDKFTEVTPDPEFLSRHAYVLTVKGALGTKGEMDAGHTASGVVIIHDRKGQIVARYFDEEFAREEVEAAGLKWDELLASNRLKQEQADFLAARRKVSPNRRLRQQRREARGSPPSPRLSPPGEGETSPPRKGGPRTPVKAAVAA